VSLMVYFIVGSSMSGLIVHSNGMRLGQARYEVVLFLVSAMDMVCWYHDLAHPELLVAAMGVQNAMITSWSTAVVRTTHMTGTATDIPAGLTFMLGVMHIVYCLLNRDKVKEEEVAETVFRRQISGKGLDDAEQQRFVQGN